MPSDILETILTNITGTPQCDIWPAGETSVLHTCQSLRLLSCDRLSHAGQRPDCHIVWPLSSCFTLLHQLLLHTEVSAIPVPVIRGITDYPHRTYWLFAQGLQLIHDSSSSGWSSAGRVVSFWPEDISILKGHRVNVTMTYFNPTVSWKYDFQGLGNDVSSHSSYGRFCIPLLLFSKMLLQEQKCYELWVSSSQSFSEGLCCCQLLTWKDVRCVK